jgi:septum formation protein
VLGADTEVAVGDTVLGKPRDREHAREMLRSLSGTTHRVLTGVCLLDARSGARLEGVARTRVTMRALADAEIGAYVDSGEGDDKAGAYAIQETGDRFVTRVDGSWSNVVGLPMELLRGLLEQAGFGGGPPDAAARP